MVPYSTAGPIRLPGKEGEDGDKKWAIVNNIVDQAAASMLRVVYIVYAECVDKIMHNRAVYNPCLYGIIPISNHLLCKQKKRTLAIWPCLAPICCGE